MRRPGSRIFPSLALAALIVSGCETGDDGARTVVISAPEQSLTGAARVTLVVDYSGTGARLVSDDGGPACAFILPGIEGDFADDRQGTLTIRATGPRALRGPADIAACRMQPSDPVETAQDLHDKLVVRLSGAEDAAGKALDIAAAKAGKAAGAASSRTQKEIDDAQAAAVKAAASIAPPPPAATDATAAAGRPPAAGAAPAGVAGAAGSAGAAGTSAAGSAFGARGAPPSPVPVPQKPASARSASPANVPRPAAPEPVDDRGQAAPVDRDRNYDDSPSDDESAPAYDLTIAVRSGGTFGALQIEVNHLGGSGGFIGRGDQVDCVSLVEAIAAANYEGERRAKIGLISLAGISTPANVVRCGFRTREPLSANSFNVVVVDAADTESNQLDPMPTVGVSTVMRR